MSRAGILRGGVALALACVLIAAMPQSRAEEPAPRQIVVTGSPQKVRFLASATEWSSEEELRVANEYSVELDRVEKIFGEGDVPRRLSLRMYATHAVNLSGEKRITVVLGVENGRFYVKHWDIIRQTTCMPRELYRNERLPEGFHVQVVDDTICLKFR
jgi:hypothetical protein